MSSTRILSSPLLSASLALVFGSYCVSCIITVNIGGANRLTSLDRSRDRYNCFWDCDLVGCQISSDDDECAYDCEKICRPRYDWARSSAQGSEIPDRHQSKGIDQQAGITGKATVPEATAIVNKEETGESVRLHLPRNATARKFAIWERCSAEETTGKLKQIPFSY